jgi:hypothetical protein
MELPPGAGAGGLPALAAECIDRPLHQRVPSEEDLEEEAQLVAELHQGLSDPAELRRALHADIYYNIQISP